MPVGALGEVESLHNSVPLRVTAGLWGNRVPQVDSLPAAKALGIAPWLKLLDSLSS